MIYTPAFITPLTVAYVDGDDWILTSDLIYHSAIIGRVCVPTGQHTDFASIPRGLWNVEPKSAYAPAGVVHDYLYRHGLVPRKQADQTFREALQVLGCGKVKRNMMYAALRVFGGTAYRGTLKNELPGPTV